MENRVENHYGDVLEGLKEEYRSLLDKPHLWSTMPRAVYLALVYEGIALKQRMGRTLAELEVQTSPGMPLSLTRMPQERTNSEGRKVPRREVPSRLRAKLEAERRTA